jgi:hypothetical protein
MAVEILTKEDLETLKKEIINEIRAIFKSKGVILQHKEWLKSYEVRKMLGISPGTLQQMRINGTLGYSQIGGLLFYKYEDIIKLMEANMHKNPLTARR